MLRSSRALDEHVGQGYSGAGWPATTKS
jgi:hypothetical protein